MAACGTDYGKANEIYAEKTKLEERLEALFAEWEELNSQSRFETLIQIRKSFGYYRTVVTQHFFPLHLSYSLQRFSLVPV